MAGCDESPTTSAGARRAPSPGTIVLVIGGPIALDDVPGLCERVRVLLEGGDADVVCDVGALTDPDVGTVDALARLALAARRLGRQVQLAHASRELRDLLVLAGLGDVVPPDAGLPLGLSRQTEQREQPRGVQKRVEPGDPTC